MQKKIIALAIAAAFSAPAFADTTNVTVYGSVNMSVNSVTVGDAGAGATTPKTTYSATKVASDTTVVGLKGSEDLGGGLSAIWQIESQVDADNAGGTFGTRNTFAGLSDKAMGTVLLGKHDTPYKMSTRALDVFGNGIADNRSIMGGNAAKLNSGGTAVVNTASAIASFDGRQGNVVAYVSPTFSGVQVIAAYVAGAEDNTGGTQGSAKSFAAMYTMDNLYVAAAYEVHNFGTAGSGTVALPSTFVAADIAGKKESAMKVGVSYKMDALTVGAAVERTSDDLNLSGNAGTDTFGHTAYYLSAKYNMDTNNAVKVAYTKAGETNNGDVSGLKNGATQVSVGFDHNMSKRTAVYALYTSITNDDNGTYGLSTASTAGTGALVAANYAGAKVSAFGVGMRHSF